MLLPLGLQGMILRPQRGLCFSFQWSWQNLTLLYDNEALYSLFFFFSHSFAPSFLLPGISFQRNTQVQVPILDSSVRETQTKTPAKQQKSQNISNLMWPVLFCSRFPYNTQYDFPNSLHALPYLRVGPAKDNLTDIFCLTTSFLYLLCKIYVILLFVSFVDRELWPVNTHKPMQLPKEQTHPGVLGSLYNFQWQGP